MQLINLTQHEIRLRISDPIQEQENPDNITEYVIEPDLQGRVARVAMVYEDLPPFPIHTPGEGHEVGDATIARAMPGTIHVIRTEKDGTKKREAFPEPRPGICYLVSALVAQAANRADVLAPDTGESAIRFTDGDRKGQIEAVTRLLHYIAPPM